MSKSTFLELCQKTRQECSIPGDGPASVTDQNGILRRVVTWVADADYLIQSSYADWKFLWSSHQTDTIANIAAYSAPADFGSWDLDSAFLDFAQSTYRHLKHIDYEHWRQVYRNGTQTSSRPTTFAVRPDNAILLHPVPDAAYSLNIEYYAAPTRLAANTDTSAIPERYEQAIIALAKSKFAEEEGSPVLLQNALQEYGFWAEEMKKRELPDQMSRAQARGEELVVRPV